MPSWSINGRRIIRAVWRVGCRSSPSTCTNTPITSIMGRRRRRMSRRSCRTSTGTMSCNAITPRYTRGAGVRGPRKDHTRQAVWWAVGVALSLVLTVGGVHAADTFHRLSAQEMRAKIIGHVITDDTHWSQHFRPDGTLQSIVLSRQRQGTWHIEGNTLCRTLTRRGKTTTACSEVWMWQDHVEYREQGVTVPEGFVRQEWR